MKNKELLEMAITSTICMVIMMILLLHLPDDRALMIIFFPVIIIIGIMSLPAFTVLGIIQLITG